MSRSIQRGIWLVLAAPLLVLLVLVSAAPPAAATQTTLNAVGQGWYQDTGYHVAALENYFVGTGTNPPYEQHRDFFVFSLSGVTGTTIVSATLRVPNPVGATGAGTLSLYAVSTSISSLTAGYPSGSATGQAIYADLGDGTVYGSTTLTSADLATNPVDVTINTDGLAALNASQGGSFAVGGDYPGGKGVFGGTDATDVPQLILQVTSIPPSAPTGVAAKVLKTGHGKNAVKTGVQLTWTDGATGGSPITDHSVQIYSRSKGAFTLITTIDTASDTTSFTVPDNEFSPAGSYAFKVAAVNRTGTGEYSGYSKAVRY